MSVNNITYNCTICGKPATILDTEYSEYYCTVHAESYQVMEGPHAWLEDMPWLQAQPE